jgi:acyl-CoA thioesterase-1
MKIPHVALCVLFVCSTFRSAGQPTAAPGEGSSADMAAIQSLLTNKASPITWVFTGDSITHGAVHTHGERSYPEHFAERIRFEMNRRRDFVVNTGISGDTTAGILKDFDRRVGMFKPGVVSIMIGMNDCTQGPAKREKFESNLRALVQRVRAIGGVPLLHSTNPMDTRGDTRRMDLPAYNDIIFKVARDERVVLVDNWNHWRKECPDLDSLLKWLDDPVHPNARGHRELARMTFQTLQIYDEKSPTCQRVDPNRAK